MKHGLIPGAAIWQIAKTTPPKDGATMSNRRKSRGAVTRNPRNQAPKVPLISEADHALFVATVEQTGTPPSEDIPSRDSGASSTPPGTASSVSRTTEQTDLTARPFAGALDVLAKQLAANQTQDNTRRAREAAAKREDDLRALARKRSTAANIHAKPVDETQLFAQEMAGVTPIQDPDPDAVRVPASRDPRQGPKPYDDDAEVMAELADLVSGEGDFDATFAEEHIEGIAEGIDRRILRKLKRGAFSHGAHVDLHGLTRVEAKPRVERFIADARQRGIRCVLIVHGRGLHSREGIPMLKDAVNTWLLRGRIDRSVLAFCSANPTDGGVGALYVLLRK